MAATDISEATPDGEADDRGKQAAREAFEQLEDKDTEKKGGAKRIVIILLAVLLLGGGGGTAYMFMFAPETSEEVVEVVEEALPPARTVYVHMDRLVVRTQGPDGRRQNVVLQLVLDLKSYNRSRVAEARPRLREAFLKALFQPPLRRLPDGEAIDVTDIKERLRVAGDRVMGEGVILDVLLHNVTVGYGL